MNSCIFCAIVAGKSPASLVYEDETVVAFLDINPVTPGHLLVVPKEHFAGLDDLDEAAGKHVFTAGQRIARALYNSGLRCEGIDFFLADGEAAGQEVFHVHLHLIPRFRGDGFRLSVSRPPRPSRPELDREAAQIREALGSTPQAG